MLRKTDDDLFQESTMTFGQHLEELRVCLFKSVLGLVVGVLIGLLVGKPVVAFIKTPLQKALTEFYVVHSQEMLEAKLTELEKAGRPLPGNYEELADMAKEDGLLVDEVYVNPADLIKQLKQLYPGKYDDLEVPQPANPKVGIRRSDLAPLLLWHPLEDDPRVHVKSLNAQEPFTIYVKAALLVGVVVASPWIFYQIWLFVGAGLYWHERKYVYMYLPMSLALFLAGVVAACLAFQPILDFLFSFNRGIAVDPDPRINEWLGFVLFLPIGFGIGFQLPLVMFFLERIGIFTVGSYLRKWKVAVMVIFVAAAILCPPDPYSMLLLAFPMTFLYFLGILLCHYMPRRRPAYEELGR